MIHIVQRKETQECMLSLCSKSYNLELTGVRILKKVNYKQNANANHKSY